MLNDAKYSVANSYKATAEMQIQFWATFILEGIVDEKVERIFRMWLDFYLDCAMALGLCG